MNATWAGERPIKGVPPPRVTPRIRHEMVLHILGRTPSKRASCSTKRLVTNPSSIRHGGGGCARASRPRARPPALPAARSGSSHLLRPPGISSVPIKYFVHYSVGTFMFLFLTLPVNPLHKPCKCSRMDAARGTLRVAAARSGDSHVGRTPSPPAPPPRRPDPHRRLHRAHLPGAGSEHLQSHRVCTLESAFRRPDKGLWC